MTALPEVAATTCNQCPWRRKSAAGWLGPYDADEWLAIVHSDAPIACHITIDEDEDWEAEGLRQCAGAARYRANVFKSPRNPEVARGPVDHDRIFSRDSEFRDHHNRSPR